MDLEQADHDLIRASIRKIAEQFDLDYWRKKDKAMLGNKGDKTAIKESVFATRYLRQKADAAIAQDKTDRALPP